MPWDAVNAVGSCGKLRKVMESYGKLWRGIQCGCMPLKVAHGCGKLWIVAGVEYYATLCMFAILLYFAERLERLLNNVDMIWDAVECAVEG